MNKNAPIPSKEANTLKAQYKNTVTGTLEVCKTFARCWTAYSEGAWSNDDLEAFLTEVYDGGAGYGPNPRKTILHVDNRDKEGRFTIGSNAASFSRLKKVGEHPLFSEEKVLEVCRLNQIGLLTGICSAYDFIAKQTSPSRAKTEIIKLLKRGSEVTGPEITALRNRFEGAKPKPEPKAEAGTETTLMEIISSGTTFDNLLLTPPDDLMTEVGDSSEGALRQKFDSYADILSPDADLTIAVRGEHLSATLKLARVLGKRSPSVFCLRGKPTNDRLVDISKEVILVTSKAIEQPNGSAPGGDLARQLASGVSENLHLFAESGADGWSVVLGTKASLPEGE